MKTGVTVVIPVFNEQQNIERSIDAIMLMNSDSFNFEVVIVNDGSTDSTREILENLKAKYDFHLIDLDLGHAKACSAKKRLLGSPRCLSLCERLHN